MSTLIVKAQNVFPACALTFLNSLSSLIVLVTVIEGMTFHERVNQQRRCALTSTAKRCSTEDPFMTSRPDTDKQMVVAVVQAPNSRPYIKSICINYSITVCTLVDMLNLCHS